MPFAAAGAVASVAAAGIGAAASSSAAGKSSKAAEQSAKQQRQMWQYTTSLEDPFVQGGQQALWDMQYYLPQWSNYQSKYYDQAAANVPNLPNLPNAPTLPNTPTFGQAPGAPTLPNAPAMMTQEQLEKTPGYQFTLAQGLKATQNAAAARGLGISGAALKGAADYATGLADKTYQNQFANSQTIWQDQTQALQQDYLNRMQGFGVNTNLQQQDYQNRYASTQQNYQNLLNNALTGFNAQNTRYQDYLGLGNADLNQVQANYQRLLNLASLGANAAAQVGTTGVNAGNNIGNSLMAAGNAQAAGIQGVGNALTGGINNLTGSLMYGARNGLFGGGSSSGAYVPGGNLSFDPSAASASGMYGGNSGWF
jgi:hypothetical protein